MSPALGEHLRAGSGPPLLLLHGFTATWHTWGPVATALTATHDVLAPTLPGHTGGPPLPEGESVDLVTDALEAMLDEAGWRNAHVAGFSFGGWLAFELAKRGRARTVTAISPGGATTERHEREARRIKLMFRRGWRSARAVEPWVDDLVRRPRFRRLALADHFVHGERVSPAETAAIIRAFARTPVFERFVGEIGRPPGLEGLETVRVPVTLLWGERDRVLPLRLHGPFFRERLPHAEVEVLPRAGHVPFWDAPEAIVAAVLRRTAALSAAPG